MLINFLIFKYFNSIDQFILNEVNAAFFSNMQWLVDFPVAVLNCCSKMEFKIPWSKCIVLFLTLRMGSKQDKLHLQITSSSSLRYRGINSKDQEMTVSTATTGRSTYSIKSLIWKIPFFQDVTCLFYTAIWWPSPNEEERETKCFSACFIKGSCHPHHLSELHMVNTAAAFLWKLQENINTYCNP